MKKYVLLSLLPLLVISCNSGSRYANRRPSKTASDDATYYTEKGLSYPNMGIDQAVTSTHDVADDSAAYVGGVGTRQVRRSSRTVTRSARRGANLVHREADRISNTVYDVGDDVAEFGKDEIVRTTDYGVNGMERTMYIGGTGVCGVMSSYGELVDGTRRGLSGGLLRCIVKDTKPYMVGSLNDHYKRGGMPGASWNRPLPDMSNYAVTAPSGKDSYTYSK
jgi:hypothetical protein